MGLGRSRLPFVTLVCGLSGALGGFILQMWANGVAYPLMISGKPLFNWQPYIPITFELGVLLAALSTVGALFAFTQLPMLFHPLFNSRAFERVTDDGFFISVEAWDPKFSALETERFLHQIGATHVELVQRGAVERRPRPGFGESRSGHEPRSARSSGWCAASPASPGSAVRSASADSSCRWLLGAAQMRHFYFSWLVAFLYFLSIALGSLFFILVLFVCRAGWSVALRRVVENVIATVPSVRPAVRPDLDRASRAVRLGRRGRRGQEPDPAGDSSRSSTIPSS
jgi:hypothetical protein